MRDHYYTAAEAADRLGLNYHTFMWRVKQGRYSFELFGKTKTFDKKTIDELVKSGEKKSCS